MDSVLWPTICIAVDGGTPACSSVRTAERPHVVNQLPGQPAAVRAVASLIVVCSPNPYLKARASRNKLGHCPYVSERSRLASP